MKTVLIRTLIIFLLATAICIPNAYALDDVIQSGDSFIASRDNNEVINQAALKSTSDYIYNILFTIAVVLAVAVGMIIAIQFMIGSIEQKAKVKETLVPYVIGVFVVFASFTIWKIAVNIGSDVAPTTNNIEYQIRATASGRGYIITCRSCGSSKIRYEALPKKLACEGCGGIFTKGNGCTTFTINEKHEYVCDYCKTINGKNLRPAKCIKCEYRFLNY